MKKSLRQCTKLKLLKSTNVVISNDENRCRLIPPRVNLDCERVESERKGLSSCGSRNSLVGGRIERIEVYTLTKVQIV